MTVPTPLAPAARIARLYGEPVFEMPQDLYIPPDALEVILEAFEGPLDLLLHLIKRNEVSIYDIPIALITEQYLGYITLMQDLNLDVAGEFLVMASTLIHIKSRTLLPRPDPTRSVRRTDIPE